MRIFQKVPKVEKSMMRSIQRKDPFPYGEALCVPLEEVVEFRQTSGTTGQPVYQPDTWQDWEWWAESWAYILYAQGFRRTDRVFLPFGYNVFVAFWAAHYAAEKMGCEVVPGGVLDTAARILKIQELRATGHDGHPELCPDHGRYGPKPPEDRPAQGPDHQKDRLRRRTGRQHPQHPETDGRGLGGQGL